VTVNSDIRELGGSDPHALLGLRRGASRQEVAQAFRRNAAQGGHPDTGGDDKTFRQLTRARDVLLDPRRLTAYDAARQAAGSAHGEDSRTRRPESPPASHGRGGPEAPRERAGNGTRVTQAEQRRSSVPTVPAETNAWAVITVVLVLLGPLLWPAAVLTGLLALRRMMKRPAPR
jgi:curved DNA-binding protein CbpA